MSVVRITVAIEAGNVDKRNSQNPEGCDQKRLSIRDATFKELCPDRNSLSDKLQLVVAPRQTKVCRTHSLEAPMKLRKPKLKE
jgi:hypothetical protein